MSKEINVSASEGGQAAVRDINNHNTTILQFPQLKPESQLQAEFAQRTGIWCPKPAREWLEHLMEHHRFTARELTVAWKAGSIGWNAEEDTKRVSTPWIEAMFGYSMVGIMGIYFLTLALQWIFTPEAKNKWVAMAAVYGVGLLYLGICWMSYRFMLWPRRIAIKVRKKIETFNGGHK